MADFKRRNKTWVLLIDVDEYITFNRISDTSENVEPEAFPMEEAPDGIPTLMDWYSEDDFINGWVLNHSSASTTKVKIGPLVPQTQSQVIQPGGIVTDDVSGNAYYLRDDLAIRDAHALAEPPEPMPTLTYLSYDNEGAVCGNIFGNIYDDDDWKDGEYACIQVDDETPYDQQNKTNVLHGGYVVEDEYKRKYFLEKEQALWPKRLTLKEAREARERLSRSRVDERKTILDVVMEESIRYGNETMGPCVIMPRLRYGSFEASKTTAKSSTLGEINPDDFVTLRYRWHGIKGNYTYGKTLIDYATSPFRVNHYLDSLEAFLYREDVRVSRSTIQYCTLAKEGNYSMDTEDSLWLQEFVQDVGSENAKKLLEGTGSFPRLQWSLGDIFFSCFYGKPHCI